MARQAFEIDVPMFNGWLEAMWVDQAMVQGLHVDTMTPEQLQSHIRAMGVALMLECAELIEELQWKPWKATTDTFPVRNTKEHIAAEAVDVLHFLAHLLNAAGVTEEQLNTVYEEKRRVNAERARGGYSY